MAVLEVVVGLAVLGSPFALVAWLTRRPLARLFWRWRRAGYVAALWYGAADRLRSTLPGGYILPIRNDYRRGYAMTDKMTRTQSYSTDARCAVCDAYAIALFTRDGELVHVTCQFDDGHDAEGGPSVNDLSESALSRQFDA
jgi:hypothetical protein